MIMFGDMYLGFKFDDYPNNGSKVTAVFQYLNFGWDFRTLGFWGQFLGDITPKC